MQKAKQRKQFKLYLYHDATTIDSNSVSWERNSLAAYIWFI